MPLVPLLSGVLLHCINFFYAEVSVNTVLDPRLTQLAAEINSTYLHNWLNGNCILFARNEGPYVSIAGASGDPVLRLLFTSAAVLIGKDKGKIL